MIWKLMPPKMSYRGLAAALLISGTASPAFSQLHSPYLRASAERRPVNVVPPNSVWPHSHHHHFHNHHGRFRGGYAHRWHSHGWHTSTWPTYSWAGLYPTTFFVYPQVPPTQYHVVNYYTYNFPGNFLAPAPTPIAGGDFDPDVSDDAFLDEMFGMDEPASSQTKSSRPDSLKRMQGEEVFAIASSEQKSNSVELAGWKAPKVSELGTRTAKARGPIRVERAKPAIKLLTPTSPAWTDSAVGTVDDLVARGEFEAAIEACESMSRNPKIPADIYLRHALLMLFGTREAVENDKVLDLLNSAAAGGCDLNPVELNCESVRIYIAPMDVSFDETLDQFSKLAMKDPSGSIDLLLLIAALLKLDGQTERSSIFAKEAFERASQSGELKWNSLTIALMPE